MTNETSEDILIRFLVEAEDAIKNIKELREETRKATNEMIKANNETGESWTLLARAMNKSVDKMVENMKITTTRAKLLKEAIINSKNEITANEKKFVAEQGSLAKQSAMQIKESEKIIREEQKKTLKEKERLIKQALIIEKERPKSSKEVVSAIRLEREEIERLKETLKSVQKETSRPFDEIGEQMKKLGENSKNVNRALKEVKAQTKDTTDGFKIFGKSIKGVGDILGLVFGSILGVSAIGALRDFARFLREAIVEALEFSRSIFKLSVSVRALQRRGLDITFKSSMETVRELRKEFGIFSEKELVDGVAQIQLLTRNMGLSIDQMEDMSRISASLSVLLGKDFNESAKGVALFLSSGYAEALQRAGIAVNKMTIQQEAMAAGVFKSFRQLTEQERALFGYTAIMRQAADTFEDAARFQETLTGQIDAGTKAIEQQRAEIGLRLLPTLRDWIQLKELLINTFATALDSVMKLHIMITSAQDAMIQASKDVFDRQLDDAETFLDRYNKLFLENFAELSEEIFPELFDPLEGGGLGEGIEGLDPSQTARLEIFNELREALIDSQRRMAQDLTDAEIDLQRDLAEIDDDGAQRRFEIWRDFGRDMTDLNLKMIQRINDTNAKAQLDRLQIIRSFDSRIEEAQEDFRRKEIDRERKFQEKLRQLRENFLLSLDDAIRARDAFQIARLKRQFALNKARLERQNKDDKKSRKADADDRIEDLERQRAERLRVFDEEHAFRLAQIEEDARREREQLAVERERDLADLKADLEDQRKERELAHKRLVDEDMPRHNQERLNLLLAGLADELDATEEDLNKILEMWESIYGPNGGILEAVNFTKENLGEKLFPTSPGDIPSGGFELPKSGPNLPSGFRPTLDAGLFSYNVELGDTLSSIAKKFGITVDRILEFNKISDPDEIFQGQRLTIPTFEKGGSMFASKPTIVQFGEVPEIMTVTPLSQMSGRGGREQHEVTVMLEEGLKGEMIDATMDEMSRVIVKVQNSTRRR